MMFFGGGVLLVGIALHVAWIGKRAEAKGRSVLGWVALGVALACSVCAPVSCCSTASTRRSRDAAERPLHDRPITLDVRADDLGRARAARAAGARRDRHGWPVHEKLDGAGKLVIEEDASSCAGPAAPSGSRARA